MSEGRCLTSVVTIDAAGHVLAAIHAGGSVSIVGTTVAGFAPVPAGAHGAIAVAATSFAAFALLPATCVGFGDGSEAGE